MKKKSTEKKK